MQSTDHVCLFASKYVSLFLLLYVLHVHPLFSTCVWMSVCVPLHRYVCLSTSTCQHVCHVRPPCAFFIKGCQCKAINPLLPLICYDFWQRFIKQCSWNYQKTTKQKVPFKWMGFHRKKNSILWSSMALLYPRDIIQTSNRSWHLELQHNESLRSDKVY